MFLCSVYLKRLEVKLLKVKISRFLQYKTFAQKLKTSVTVYNIDIRNNALK